MTRKATFPCTSMMCAALDVIRLFSQANSILASTRKSTLCSVKSKVFST